MADTPINLNRARKARARDAARKAADANAAKFGRPKADRARDAAETARDTARLEAHRRDTDDGDAGPA